jgi:hypothetical protein
MQNLNERICSCTVCSPVRESFMSGSINANGKLNGRAVHFVFFTKCENRLCGLVVRVPGYRSRGPGFHSRRYQIFWEVVGLERGPLSLVSTTEELLGWNSSGSGLESREYGRRDPSRWTRDTFYPQTLALTSRTSWGRSVGIVLLRTQAMELLLVIIYYERIRLSTEVKQMNTDSRVFCAELRLLNLGIGMNQRNRS